MELLEYLLPDSRISQLKYIQFGEDGAYKLFFNTAGHIGNISPRLKELLAYMNDTKAHPVGQSDNDLINHTFS